MIRKSFFLLFSLLLIGASSLSYENTYHVVTKENKISNANVPKETINQLIIPKISLKQTLYNKDSYLNNVEYAVTYLNKSDYPDKTKGIVILAAHSGNSSISYFENLNDLRINDDIYLKYNNDEYQYQVTNITTENKNGYITIPDKEKRRQIVLTTCHPLYKDKQLIIIGKET